jgi:hypothetical protein
MVWERHTYCKVVGGGGRARFCTFIGMILWCGQYLHDCLIPISFVTLSSYSGETVIIAYFV